MLADRSPRPRLAEPSTHDAHAADTLRFIRETMERSTSFTAVPGWEMAVVGCTAVIAAVVAAGQDTRVEWLVTWLVEACFAIGFAGWATVRKARAEGIPILSGPGRKYTLGLLPPIVAGALLTIALVRSEAWSVLPSLWLMLAGAGIITGGAFSIRVVPIMGLLQMVAGALALLFPVGAGDLYMGIGFGGIFILFGIFIARNHGG